MKCSSVEVAHSLRESPSRHTPSCWRPEDNDSKACTRFGEGLLGGGTWAIKDMSQYPPALIISLTCVWLSSTIRFAFAEAFTKDVLDSRFFPLVSQESMQIA